jgi:hypothetical protein
MKFIVTLSLKERKADPLRLCGVWEYRINSFMVLFLNNIYSSFLLFIHNILQSKSNRL